MKTKIPQIYFNTMGEAINAAIDRAKDKGYIVTDETEDMTYWDAMLYETYQTKLYTLYKNNVQSKKCLNISLYRMPSGNYELTTYIN